jgi:hypothetical protein
VVYGNALQICAHWALDVSFQRRFPLIVPATGLLSALRRVTETTLTSAANIPFMLAVAVESLAWPEVWQESSASHEAPFVHAIACANDVLQYIVRCSSTLTNTEQWALMKKVLPVCHFLACACLYVCACSCWIFPFRLLMLTLCICASNEQICIEYPRLPSVLSPMSVFTVRVGDGLEGGTQYSTAAHSYTKAAIFVGWNHRSYVQPST